MLHRFCRVNPVVHCKIAGSGNPRWSSEKKQSQGASENTPQIPLAMLFLHKCKFVPELNSSDLIGSVG